MNGLVIGRCPKTAEQLATFCNTVKVVLDNSFSRSRKLPDLNQFDIIYSGVNISSVKGIYARALEIKKWIKEFDLNIVFTNTKWDMVAAKLATIGLKKKVILLSTSHNSYAWFNHKNVVLMSKLIKWTTDIYVSLASFVKRKLVDEGLDSSSILVVPNTVGYDSWTVKSDYSLSHTIRIVYLAYVYPGKRQDFILDVIHKLASKYDIEVDCYGDKDEFLDYVKLIDDKSTNYNLNSKFHLCGKIENSELRAKLHEYDIYFCPSYMEMSPVNILEAQAAGLPVLASNVGGIPDIIHDNETGFLYNVDDVDDAVRQLTKLIEDSEIRSQLGTMGRKYVSEVYTKVEAGLLIKEKIDELLK